MHKRGKNSQNKSSTDSQSKGLNKQQTGHNSGTAKKSKMPLRRSSKGNLIRTLFSWMWSFTKLILTIGLFVLLVYIYDERIVFGFASEMGWMENRPSLKGETGHHPVEHFQQNMHDHVRKENSHLKDIVDGDSDEQNSDGNPKNILEKEGGKNAVEKTEASTENQEGKKNRHGMERRGSTSGQPGNRKYVLQVLTNSDQHPHLQTRFDVCMRSILEKSSVDLHFFFVVDTASEKFIMQCLQEVTDEGISKSQFQLTFLHVESLGKKLLPHIGDLQAQLRGGHPYYTDTIFFLSLGIHKHILPRDVRNLVIMDTDLKFMSDIKLLFDQFDSFSEENVMGFAHEQQPVYRHLLSLYRSQNRGTIVGDPPPHGLTGFNSGVILLDLERMRSSQSYAEVLTVEFIQKYSEKYHFKGHLGDQDFFTLVSLERPELFYVLPCSWNKQLCIWWKDKGYANVFDLYFNCPQPIHVYHGNCNTPIP